MFRNMRYKIHFAIKEKKNTAKGPLQLQRRILDYPKLYTCQFRFLGDVIEYNLI